MWRFHSSCMQCQYWVSISVSEIDSASIIRGCCDQSCILKLYLCQWTHNSSYEPLTMETEAVSETLTANSALAQRISQEEFIVHIITFPNTMIIIVILTCWQKGSFKFTDFFMFLSPLVKLSFIKYGNSLLFSKNNWIFLVYQSVQHRSSRPISIRHMCLLLQACVSIKAFRQTFKHFSLLSCMLHVLAILSLYFSLR